MLEKLLDNASKIQALNEAILSEGTDLSDLIPHYCHEYGYTEKEALEEIKSTYCLLIKTL